MKRKPVNINIHTCGNATLIVECDGKPIIATDPWLHFYRCYFGSWATTKLIPDYHLELLEKCNYIWISHYHPDHLSIASLSRIKAKNKTILLCEQFSNRVAKDLRAKGYKVLILPKRNFINIANGLEIATFPTADTIDSALLIRANNCLVVNLNDTDADSSVNFIKKEVAKVDHSILLKLAGYGDVDMINIYDQDNNFIEPLASQKPAPGFLLTQNASKFNCKSAMHFSSFHKYVREDSLWANKYTTPESDLLRGWKKEINYFKQFSSLSLTTDGIKKMDNIAYPKDNDIEILPAKKFGDNWEEEPNSNEIKEIKNYLNEVNKIYSKRDFIQIMIGKTIIKPTIENKNYITLQAPKNSVLRSVRENIFDDLLIGNFAKLIINNKSNINYHSIFRFASKIHDNAEIRNGEELKEFFTFVRDSFDSKKNYFNYRFKKHTRELILSNMREKIGLLSKLKNIYQRL